MNKRSIGKTGVEVFPLGLGVMRLPLYDGGTASPTCSKDDIDVAASENMIRRAVELGVNYIDTAMPYAAGMSEAILGGALRKFGLRDKVYLATKATPWLQNTPEDFDRHMAEQMRRLGTDHIDFYLIHSINRHHWSEKVLPLGMIEHLMKAKADGRVGHIGFSFHDDFDLFREVLDYAPWDFCQIQLNYLDVACQAGLKGLRLAAERGMGVIIMEPLRGGYLAAVPDDVAEALGRQKTPIEHALDFLWDMPEVSLLLSGCSMARQVEENVRYAERSSVGMLTEAERAAYDRARAQFSSRGTIPCTGCGYCRCPNGVVIPNNFNVYNEYITTGDRVRADEWYNIRVPLFGGKASDCIGCGTCETFCPQGIPISEWMRKIDETLSD